MELIQADHITFSYSRKPVLTDVSLSVRQGEIVSLLGPNGSGKTTLLKVILGIYPPKLGTVFFNGRSVSEIAPKELAKKIAYVPQFHKMVFAYKVTDIVLMGRTPHKS
ncbi:MAG: ABC transporter ATP-binding protein, partial [Desulfobacterales bacterium]